MKILHKLVNISLSYYCRNYHSKPFVDKIISLLYSSLSGCTEDAECNDDAERGVCDITKNECVGKLH